MLNARFLLAALLVSGAALAACSGNFGAGTTAPGQVIPSGPLNPGSPSPSPNSANGIVTYGESDTMQQLPMVGGYGGTISFPVPSPKPSGFDNVPIGVTVALVAPTDAPDLNTQVGGKRPKRRERPARPLLYVTLLATRDITLASYPRIALDVPREIVTIYRESELGLAFYNSTDKSKTYRLDVATQEGTPPPASPRAVGSGSVAPGTPSPTATPSQSSAPSASPSPTPTPTASGSPLPGRSPTPLRSASPTPSPTLPPQRITFAAAAGPLKLSANKPATFALYALPVATPAAKPGTSSAPSAASASSPSATSTEASNVEPSIAPPAAPSAPVAPAAPAVASASPRSV